MAAIKQILIVLVGLVMVQSHHLHHSHHHHHHLHHKDKENPNNVFHPGFFGIGLFGSGIFGNGGSVPDEYVNPGINNFDGGMAYEGNNALPNVGLGQEDLGIGLGMNIPNLSNIDLGQPGDINISIPVPNGPDVNINIERPSESEESDAKNKDSPADNKPTQIISPDNNADIDQSQVNSVPSKPIGQNANVGLDASITNNDLNEKNKDTIDLKVPEFTDEDLKKGIVMVDPDLKYNKNVPNEPKVSDKVQYTNVDGGFNPTEAIINLPNKSEEKTDAPIVSEKVGFNDDEIKKGILMIDPELKYNTNTVFETKVPEIDVGKEPIQKKSNITAEHPEDFIENSKKESGIVSDNININATIGEPKLVHNSELQFPVEVKSNEKAVPEFNDDDIKRGILMLDPESKDPTLNKYSDNVVFPDSTENTNKQNLGYTNNKPNLPNRFNTADINKDNSAIAVPVLNSTTTPLTNKIPNQWLTNNNNHGTPNQYTLTNNAGLVQNPNENVPVRNDNGLPYVSVVKNSNGEYEIVKNPSDNNRIYVTGNTDSGVINPGQVYVSSNSKVNNPSQIYIPGNLGVKNQGQIYVADNSGNNAGYNPGKVYVSGSSGTNNQGQIYVPANYGTSNPGQIYVPNNIPASASGGYYNVINLSNGQTILVPVNNGQSYDISQSGQPNGQIYVPVNYNARQGYQVLEANPTGNGFPLGSSGITGGPTNNVPLLISYKDKEADVKVNRSKEEDEKLSSD